MLTGRHVFLYQCSEKFTNPHPAIITGEAKDEPGLVDVVAFFPKGSAFAHSTPFERVLFCNGNLAAEDGIAKRYRWICAPYSPEAPEALVEEHKETETPPTRTRKQVQA